MTAAAGCAAFECARARIAVGCARVRRSLFSLASSLSFLFIAGAAIADDFVKVIPPGNEALVSEMVGNAASLPEKCALDRVSIDRTKVVAAYVCDAKHVAIELVHPKSPDAAGAAATTKEFAIVAKDGPPRALVDAITARVAEREKAWRWTSAEAPGLAVVDDSPAPPVAALSAFTPEESEEFTAGVRLYRDGKMHEAFEAFRALAKKNPRNGVLGMIVASLASTSPQPAEVDRFAADADAHPDDLIAQFVAGVASHYCGHRNAKTREEKATFYERAVKYLSRTRPAFDFEPRVFVYLAVSHYRLGERAEAEQLIEAAVPLAKNDPDVYYCRAEVFHRTNVARSIEDIRKYLAMSDELEKQGVPANKAKRERVEKMLTHLEAVSKGAAADDEELFDPLPEVPMARAEPPPPRAVFVAPRTFGAIAVAIAALSTAVWLASKRRAPR